MIFLSSLFTLNNWNKTFENSLMLFYHYPIQDCMRKASAKAFKLTGASDQLVFSDLIFFVVVPA